MDYWKRLRIHRRKQAHDLLGGTCAHCGRTEHLEFDHTDPATKTANVTEFWHHREERFLEEVEKCQLLCHDCHTDKTLAEKGHQRARHGSTTMYRRGCRCSPCREAAADYQRLSSQKGRR